MTLIFFSVVTPTSVRPVEQPSRNLRQSVGRRNFNDGKTFFSRGGGEAIVERDYFQRRRPALGSQERRRKLQPIGRTERMHPKKSCRRFPDRVAGIDFVPA